MLRDPTKPRESGVLGDLMKHLLNSLVFLNERGELIRISQRGVDRLKRRILGD